MSPGPPPISPPTTNNRRKRLGCVIASGVLLLLLGVVGVITAVVVKRIVWTRRESAVEQTRTAAQRLIVACLGYQAEYQRWPVEAEVARVMQTTDGGLLAVLRGENEDANPREVDLFGTWDAAGQGSGVRSDGALVDAWGQPFRVLFDADHDGLLTNPDPRGEPRTLNMAVAVFSAGPDGDPETWEDNVTTWASAK